MPCSSQSHIVTLNVCRILLQYDWSILYILQKKDSCTSSSRICSMYHSVVFLSNSTRVHLYTIWQRATYFTFICTSAHLTINARYMKYIPQYVYYNLLAHILFLTSSYVLVSVLYSFNELKEFFNPFTKLRPLIILTSDMKIWKPGLESNFFPFSFPTMASDHTWVFGQYWNGFIFLLLKKTFHRFNSSV